MSPATGSFLLWTMSIPAVYVGMLLGWWLGGVDERQKRRGADGIT